MESKQSELHFVRNSRTYNHPEVDRNNFGYTRNTFIRILSMIIVSCTSVQSVLHSSLLGQVNTITRGQKTT